MELEKYSLGVGDRFGREGVAQLRALAAARARGVFVAPVWNKSNREHTLIGTSPDDARRRVDEAVVAAGWRGSHYVDADHIGLANVDRFLEPCDFFTIDVADQIGRPAEPETTAAFLRAMAHFVGPLRVPGMSGFLDVSGDLLSDVARKYLFAAEEAGRVYRRIVEKKGAAHFVTEISIDEADSPQRPAELFFILAALAREDIAVQTIAPKFSGAFLKGVDYVGDVRKFEAEFEDDLAVVAFARRTFGLPANLKLSVHSGSDKFSLYPVIHRLMVKHDAGIHLKTAGTTWLEEVIGLAASGGEGLAMAKNIYARAFARFDELAKPYLAVIDIDRAKLPSPDEVACWSSGEFVEALEHEPSRPRFNGDFRQLVHIAFRIAAEAGSRFTNLLETHREIIEAHVKDNLLRRHIEPLFLGESAGHPPEFPGTY
jgi:tagaturonate epimerase